MPIVQFPLEGSEAAVLVDVDEPIGHGLERVAVGGDALLRAGRTLQSALAGVKPILQAVLNTLREVSPDQAEVEMGFKLTAESGVVLTKASGETHLVVKLTWKGSNKPA